MKRTQLQLAVLSGMLITMSATVNAQWNRNAGTQQTYLTNTGDFLGVGTTNPQFKIDVQSTGIATMSFKSTTNNASLLLDRGSATSTSAVQYRSQGVNVWQAGIVSNSNYKIQNNVLGAPAILIPSANNYIGIGVVPVSKLSNTPNNIVGSDNFGISPNSLTWTNNAQGYGLAVFNSSTTFKANGLAVKCAGNSGRLLDLSVGNSQTAAGTSLMVVEGDGRVGIGNQNPFTLLSNTSSNIFGIDGYGLSSTSLGWESDGFGYAAGFYNPGTNDASGGVTVKLKGNSGTVLDLSASDTVSVMTVKGNGNVGIGIANPIVKLHVDGRMRVDANGVGYEQVDAANGVSVGSYADADGGYYGTNSNHPLFLYTNFGLAQVTLTTAGNLGIGTTAPAYRLQAISDQLNTANFINTATSVDHVGAYASCNNTPFFGIGVRGEAGYIGVQGSANLSGGQGQFGVYGEASNGVNNFGVYGSASGGTAWAVYSAGSSYATGTWQSSDAKLKKDVSPITSALDKINQLQPRTYNFKTDEYTYMNLPSEKQYGFIAQELERVFPELVKDVSQPKGSDKASGMIDFKAINYVELIPVLTQAIQEQQKQMETKDAAINSLQSTVNNLQNQLNEMNQCVESLCNNSSQLKAASYEPQAASTLFQNSPNPFNQTTVIRYALSSEANSGRIIIRDLNGNLVKQVSIAQSGKGQVTINANELAQGTYTYTLEIGGSSVDTKLMVVTK